MSNVLPLSYPTNHLAFQSAFSHHRLVLKACVFSDGFMFSEMLIHAHALEQMHQRFEHLLNTYIFSFLYPIPFILI